MTQDIITAYVLGLILGVGFAAVIGIASVAVWISIKIITWMIRRGSA